MADVETAPVIYYSKMVWRAITRRADAMSRGASLADIRAMWEASHPRFEPLVQSILEARGADGLVPTAVARRAWAEVSGPLAAAALSLARIGWCFDGPFGLKDARGDSHQLTTASPAMIKDLMRDAVRESLELKVGAKLAAQDPAFVGRRACADLAIAAAKPGRGTSRHHAAIFRSAACGAVWTATVAQARGYISDGLCPLCRGAPDTIRHRVYFCPSTAEAVAAAVPRWFLAEAERCGANTPFWTTALFPHPADTVPRPRTDLYCEVERLEGLEAVGGPAAEAGASTAVTGAVYIDGSCFPSPIRGLARAACSVIMAAVNGDPLKILRLPVPRHLPQTSQAAEHLGMAVAFEGALAPAVLAGDCSNVVNAYKEPVTRALAATKKYAGLVLSSFKDPTKRDRVEARWVKAHRTATGEEDPQTAADIQGNAAADAAAREAVDLHPAVPVDAQAEIDYFVKRAPHVARAVSTALALFPRAATGMGRAPRPSTESEARGSQRHYWQHSAGAWRCSVCNDYSTRKVLPPYRIYQRCSGKGFDHSAADFARLGHAVVKIDSDMPVLCCTRCGAWGNRRTRNLGRPCTAPTRAGTQALKRIIKGFHPLRRLGTGSAASTSPSVTITAAYDPARNTWLPIDGSNGIASAKPPRANDSVSEDPTAGDDDLRGRPSDARMADALRAHEADPHELPPEEDHAAPPSVGYASEEDVFEHGGALDQEPARRRDDVSVDTMAVDNEVDHEPKPAHPAAVSAPVAARISRRRPRDYVVHERRDLVAEAVRRLGESLRRTDVDAAGRMERLRRRVKDKAARTTLEQETRLQAGAATSVNIGRGARRAREASGGDEQPSSGEEQRLRRAAAGPHGNPATAKVTMRPDADTLPPAAMGPVAIARNDNLSSCESMRPSALPRCLLPEDQGRGEQDLLQRHELPCNVRGVKRLRHEAGGVSPEPSRRPQRICGRPEGTRSYSPPLNRPPCTVDEVFDNSASVRVGNSGRNSWGIGGAYAPELQPASSAEHGDGGGALARVLRADAACLDGGNATAAGPGAAAPRREAMTAEMQLPSPLAEAVVATREELLRRLRLDSSTSIGDSPRCGRRNPCSGHPTEQMHQPRPSRYDAEAQIRLRRAGCDADSLHARDATARAAAQPLASAEAVSHCAARPAGCSVDSARTSVTASPVRLVVPAAAVDFFTDSSSVSAESMLPRRRLRGKQSALGRPHRGARDAAGQFGISTAMAEAGAASPTVAASRDERPPAT